MSLAVCLAAHVFTQLLEPELRRKPVV